MRIRASQVAPVAAGWLLPLAVTALGYGLAARFAGQILPGYGYEYRVEHLIYAVLWGAALTLPALAAASSAAKAGDTSPADTSFWRQAWVSATEHRWLAVPILAGAPLLARAAIEAYWLVVLNPILASIILLPKGALRVFSASLVIDLLLMIGLGIAWGVVVKTRSRSPAKSALAASATTLLVTAASFAGTLAASAVFEDSDLLALPAMCLAPFLCFVGFIAVEASASNPGSFDRESLAEKRL